MKYAISFIFSLIVFSFKGTSQENKFDYLSKLENFKDSSLSTVSFTIDELDTVVFDINAGNFNSDFIEISVSIIIANNINLKLYKI